jgi:hypothetical protein
MMKGQTMTASERIGAYALAILVGAIMGVWGCVVAANDDHILTVGECMNQTANERNISHQEAWIICERNQ